MYDKEKQHQMGFNRVWKALIYSEGVRCILEQAWFTETEEHKSKAQR